MTGGNANSSVIRVRHLTPKEFATELRERSGISVTERTIADRCGLPESDARHIRTNPLWRPRHFIPESELSRLAGIKEVSA